MITDRIMAYLGDAASVAPDALPAEVAARVEQATRRQFCEVRQADPGGWRRLSNAGKCQRRLFYQAAGAEAEPLQARTRIVFWYGDVVEQMVLGLAKAAGCDVYDEQHEVRLGDVVGHVDAMLRVPRPPTDDGRECAPLAYVVEVKSMSDYSYEDFVAKGLDDTWGYVSQAKAYAVATSASGTIVVGCKKSTGHLHEQIIEATHADYAAIEARFAATARAIAARIPPARPYKPEAIIVRKQITAEEKLPVVCSYCPYKKPCWESEGFSLGFHNGKPIWKRDARMNGGINAG